MKLAIWIFLLSFIGITDVMACEEAKFTPKEFYSLAGRQACKATLAAGCGCEVVDNDFVFYVGNKGELLPPNCKPSYITFENPTPDLSARIQFTVCIEQRGKDTPPADTVTPIDEIFPTTTNGGDDGLLERLPSNP